MIAALPFLIVLIPVLIIGSLLSGIVGWVKRQ